MADRDLKSALSTKLFYACGSLAYGIKDQGFQGILLLYYNQVLGLSAVLVSAALLIALFVDALIDPIIGHVSDGWRSRLGRRHPLMYASILPVAVTFLAVWNPPSSLTDVSLFVYLVLSAVALRASLSMYEIPSASLMPELAESYDERTSLLSLRYFFGIVGAFGMVIAVFLWFLAPTREYPVGQLNPSGYHTYSFVAVGLMLAAMLVSAVGTQRVAKRLSAPPARPGSIHDWLKEAWQVLANRSLATILAFGVCSGLASGLATAMGVYFGTYYWGLDGPSMALLALAALCGTVSSAVLATPMTRRLGKKRAALSTLVVTILLPVTPILLREGGLLPANGSAVLLPILFVERTISIAAVMIAIISSASMAADIVEDVQLRTGRRAEGLLQAATTFVSKAASGLGILTAGMILWAARFPEGTKPSDVSPEGLSNLANGYVAVVVIAYSVAFLCLSHYPISRSDHEESLRRLALRSGSGGAGEARP